MSNYKFGKGLRMILSHFVKMSFIWELYALAQPIIINSCKYKCINLRRGLTQKCEDYVLKRISNKTYRYKTKTYKWTTHYRKLTFLDFQYQFNEFSHPSNQYQSLKNYDHSKGTSPKTYLNMLVASRIKDFLNSAPIRREFVNEYSINNSVQENHREDNFTEIKEVIFSLLSDKEALYIEEFYLNSKTAKELASIYGVYTDIQILKILENARKKLKPKLQKMGYELEDLLEDL